MKKKKKPHRINDSLLIDSARLRTALLLACMTITDGDVEMAMDMSEEFYDTAPQFLEKLATGAIDELFQSTPDIVPYIHDFDGGYQSLN